MSSTRTPWPRRLVQTIIDNPELVRSYVIPGLLFSLDCVLKFCLGIDLIDAGADMAFLAVGTFVALLVEDTGYDQKQIVSILVFILIFLIPWVVCLWMVSVQNLLPIGFLWYFLLALSWLSGFAVFVLSGVIARAVIQGPAGVNG